MGFWTSGDVSSCSDGGMGKTSKAVTIWKTVEILYEVDKNLKKWSMTRENSVHLLPDIEVEMSVPISLSRPYKAVSSEIVYNAGTSVPKTSTWSGECVREEKSQNHKNPKWGLVISLVHWFYLDYSDNHFILNVPPKSISISELCLWINFSNTFQIFALYMTVPFFPSGQYSNQIKE